MSIEYAHLAKVGESMILLFKVKFCASTFFVVEDVMGKADLVTRGV